MEPGGETIVPPVVLGGEPLTLDIEHGRRGSAKELRYYVSNSLPSDVSMDGSKEQETILAEANETVCTLISTANKHANFYRTLSIMNDVYTIAMGVVISVLNAQSQSSDGVRWVSMGIGLSLAAFRSMASMFNINSRSVLAKDIYNRARALRRTLVFLKNRHHVDDREIMPIAAEIDDLSMNLFNGDVPSDTGAGNHNHQTKTNLNVTTKDTAE